MLNLYDIVGVHTKTRSVKIPRGEGMYVTGQVTNTIILMANGNEAALDEKDTENQELAQFWLRACDGKMKPDFADFRRVAEEDAGITRQACQDALWSRIMDGDPTPSDAIQAKRAEIRKLYQEPGATDGT